MTPDALAGVPVRVSVRGLDAPARSAAEIIRLCRGLDQPVVLAGRWATGEVLVAIEPLVVRTAENAPPERFAVLDELPMVEGSWPDGAVGGGWFGWLGFESSQAWGFYPNVMRYAAGRWWDEALAGIMGDAELEARRQRLCTLIQTPANASAYRLGPVTASRGRSQHVAAVERCIQHIRAGEIYQANICLTMTAELEGSPADLTADLLHALEPPYGAYLGLGDTQIASASPELFLRRHGRTVTSTPIKGTRPRTPVTAATERRRLEGSAKDRAENIMIVDLVRNDLSRVAEIGSVRASRLLDVMPAPGVWHLASSVEARLGAGVRDSDLLAATFPPGSVSGAPKSRALEIIAELEDRPRGVYTGAIGYASPVAGLELSVAIRTAHISGGRVTLGVGGGITVDSTPLQEWFECFDKARPLLRAAGALVDDPVGARPAPDALAAAGIYDTSLLHYGVARDRAEHVARLQRSCYELYDRPLPPAAADVLLHPVPSEEAWERQRIQVTPDGAFTVVTAPVAAPVALTESDGLNALVLLSDAGFGGYKWADRARQLALEAQHPGHVVILGDGPAGGGLLESSRANVVAIINGRLVTAPLDGRVLPGVTRTVLLDLARDAGVGIELRAPDPRRATGLAIVNSLIGLRWICRCDQLTWDEPDEVLQELSRRLVERWRERATVAE